MKKKSWRDSVQASDEARWLCGRLPSDVKVIYSFGKTVEELKGELRSSVFFGWSQTKFGLPPS